MRGAHETRQERNRLIPTILGKHHGCYTLYPIIAIRAMPICDEKSPLAATATSLGSVK